VREPLEPSAALSPAAVLHVACRVGGPVWALDAFVRDGTAVGAPWEAVLALSAHNPAAPLHTAAAPVPPAPNALQLWSVALGATPAESRGRLAAALVHRAAVVWDLKWHPFLVGAEHAHVGPERAARRRLGVLAAATGDGGAHVYAVPPLPDAAAPVWLSLAPHAVAVLHDAAAVRCVAWSPHAAPLLLTGHDNGAVVVWSLGADAADADAHGPVLAVRAETSGEEAAVRRLVPLVRCGAAALLAAPAARAAPRHGVNAVAWDWADARLVGAACADGALRVWDAAVQPWTPVRECAVGLDAAVAVASAPEGWAVARAGGGTTVFNHGSVKAGTIGYTAAAGVWALAHCAERGGASGVAVASHWAIATAGGEVMLYRSATSAARSDRPRKPASFVAIAADPDPAGRSAVHRLALAPVPDHSGAVLVAGRADGSVLVLALDFAAARALPAGAGAGAGARRAGGARAGARDVHSDSESESSSASSSSGEESDDESSESRSSASEESERDDTRVLRRRR
jgi:hypothetical protein